MFVTKLKEFRYKIIVACFICSFHEREKATIIKEYQKDKYITFPPPHNVISQKANERSPHDFIIAFTDREDHLLFHKNHSKRIHYQKK